MSCGTSSYAVFGTHVVHCTTIPMASTLVDVPSSRSCTDPPTAGLQGLDERDAAFMQRLRNLAHEALSWPHLNGQQRLMWVTVLELDVVPMQERHPSFWR